MTDTLDEEAKQEERTAKWWKRASVVICSLLVVVTAVVGALVVILAGSYWLSTEHDCWVCLGTLLLALVCIAVVAFGIFVAGGVWSDGRRDKRTYRNNALEVAQLLAVTLTAASLLSGMLLLIFK